MNPPNTITSNAASRLRSFDSEQFQRELALKNKRTGLLVWRVSNGMVFIFFILANYMMRQVQPSWPPPGISRLDVTVPAAMTLALLVSSFFARRMQKAAEHTAGESGNAAIRSNLLIAMGLGLAFLVGMVLVWTQVRPGSSYIAIFLTMTGFHALHVLIGLGLFGYVFSKAQRKQYSADNYWSLEGAVVFWHFVDLMWLLYFVVLYLL